MRDRRRVTKREKRFAAVLRRYGFAPQLGAQLAAFRAELMRDLEIWRARLLRELERSQRPPAKPRRRRRRAPWRKLSRIGGKRPSDDR
jgi:hypothetical protein